MMVAGKTRLSLKSRLGVALALVGLYLAALTRVVVSGEWHSRRAFDALTMICLLAGLLGCLARSQDTPATGSLRQLWITRQTLVLFVLVGSVLSGIIWESVTATVFDPTVTLLTRTGWLVASLILITGRLSPAQGRAPAA